MALIGYNEWKNLVETRSEELKCPHPEDKEYCYQWNRWIKGELSAAPEYKGGKKSIGHYRGPRAGQMASKKEKQRKGSSQKGGRHDWRKQGY